jgi:hypothetical protein
MAFSICIFFQPKWNLMGLGPDPRVWDHPAPEVLHHHEKVNSPHSVDSSSPGNGRGRRSRINSKLLPDVSLLVNPMHLVVYLHVEFNTCVLSCVICDFDDKLWAWRLTFHVYVSGFRGFWSILGYWLPFLCGLARILFYNRKIRNSFQESCYYVNSRLMLVQCDTYMYMLCYIMLVCAYMHTGIPGMYSRALQLQKSFTKKTKCKMAMFFLEHFPMVSLFFL